MMRLCPAQVPLAQLGALNTCSGGKPPSIGSGMALIPNFYFPTQRRKCIILKYLQLREKLVVLAYFSAKCFGILGFISFNGEQLFPDGFYQFDDFHRLVLFMALMVLQNRVLLLPLHSSAEMISCFVTGLFVIVLFLLAIFVNSLGFHLESRQNNLFKVTLTSNSNFFRLCK